VIADGRLHARLEAPPGRVKAFGIFFHPPRVIGSISQQEDRAGEAVEDFAGELIPVAVAEGYVAGPDKSFPFWKQSVIDHQPSYQQQQTYNPGFYQ